MEIAALLVGGVAGVLARYGAALALPGGVLPWATAAVNLTGCFLIGFFDTVSSRRGFGGPHGRVLLMTGFCGAYTTFSALILELDWLLRTAPWRGAAYLSLSVFAGLALLRAGATLGAR